MYFLSIGALVLLYQLCCVSAFIPQVSVSPREFLISRLATSTQKANSDIKTCKNGHGIINESFKKLISFPLTTALSVMVGSLTDIPFHAKMVNAAQQVDPIVATANTDGDDCTTTSNPSKTTVFCRRLGLVGGRLRGCSANENCFSSSAVAAEKYLPPWTYAFRSTDTESAWTELKIAIQTQELKILRADESTRYILAAEKGSAKQPKGSSNFYEFLIRSKESLVLTRGLVDKTVYIYPLQQPISDFGVLKAKLDAVRTSIGWLTEEQ